MITTTTTTPGHAPAPPKGRRPTPLQTERGRRDRAIVALYLDGRTPEGIARILEIGPKQVRRILAASPAAEARREAAALVRLTAAEYRDLLREYRATPAALEFLALQRIDRTGDGAPADPDALDHVERRIR